MSENQTTEHENINFFVQHKRKFLIGGGILLGLTAIGTGIYLYQKKQNQDDHHPSKKAINNRSFQCTSKDYPLSYGTCHEDVKTLQRHLKKIYKADLGTSGEKKNGIDAQFGNKTKQASMQHLKKAVFTKKDIESMLVAEKFV